MQKEVNLDSGKLPGYLLLLKTNLTSRLVIIGIRFRYDNLVSRTKETLVRYEVLIPITNQFVFMFVFVLAHEEAISKRPRLKYKNGSNSVICWSILMKFCM